ncbi:bacterial luciferase family protein [Salipiger bermudensis HTCC2601]|uniref:Bacterial luciferase family protein n=1 Tax=Salipiger bermudensis (strain DSM 26914 / JCM 13377 / KCTC 12554 / HTCC2601) TaxID=314265 RepID=Q0FX41_SALBH|nr:bacterial luciferase family protein [Salipiger bermudensis HTCC2601]
MPRHSRFDPLQQDRGADPLDAVFGTQGMTVGLVTPLEAYAESPVPTLDGHAAAARRAEEAGFASIWLRDVPFFDPKFGDAAQIMDPLVYAGFLAAETRTIAIGTAGIVLPLREPIAVAKQAASIDMLTQGRFLLGLSSGDRPTEYPAFGVRFDKRADRFREAYRLIRKLQDEAFPRGKTQGFGTLSGNLDLLPKPQGDRLPMIAVGRAGQTVPWIAKNADAWIWTVDDPKSVTKILNELKAASGKRRPPPYGYSTFLDLDRNPDAPARRDHNVLRIGRKALLARLQQQAAQGVKHVAFNLRPSRRPAERIIDEMGAHILPALARPSRKR